MLVLDTSPRSGRGAPQGLQGRGCQGRAPGTAGLLYSTVAFFYSTVLVSKETDMSTDLIDFYSLYSSQLKISVLAPSSEVMRGPGGGQLPRPSSCLG